jgi:colicin import membrane protein
MSDQPYYIKPHHHKILNPDEKKNKDYSWILIGLIVISLHALLPWLTKFSEPKPKKQFRQKVLVQTVSLTLPPTELVSQAEFPKVVVPPLSAPPSELIPPTPDAEFPKEKEEAKLLEIAPAVIDKPLPEPEPIKLDSQPVPTVPEVLKEESPAPLIEPVKEEARKLEPKKEAPISPPPLSASTKETSVPKPISKKTVPAKALSQPEKKVAPVKKPQPTPTKKIAEAPPKENKALIAAQEAEKKKQQELKIRQEAEKKRKELELKEAEKKRLDEVAKKEAEKKRQQEIQAEAERKRQEELAAVEAARCQALLTKAQQNLAKNKESRDKGSSSTSLNLQNTAIPNRIDHLDIDNLKLCIETATNWTAKEISYRDEIVLLLQGALRLPEFGTSQIELTINKNGKVEKIKILSSENAKNKLYIEQKIPGLKFPSFGNRFQESSECTFKVTLKNERKA